MDVLRTLAACTFALLCTGCQISYYMHSAYNQSKLANGRKPIEKVLRSSKLEPDTRRKLILKPQAAGPALPTKELYCNPYLPSSTTCVATANSAPIRKAWAITLSI